MGDLDLPAHLRGVIGRLRYSCGLAAEDGSGGCLGVAGVALATRPRSGPSRLTNPIGTPPERGNALLKTTYTALPSARRIGHIVAAALVLLSMNHFPW